MCLKSLQPGALDILSLFMSQPENSRTKADKVSHQKVLEDWKSAWQNAETPWHGQSADSLLFENYSRLSSSFEDPDRSPRAFVPLCGNSFAVSWLLSQGFKVTALDVSRLAIEQLIARDFTEASLTPGTRDKFEILKGENIQFLIGDFFEYQAEQKFELIYDRAALIAIQPADRRKYVRQLLSLLEPSGLIVLEKIYYPINDELGPPFSVSDEELHNLFDACKLEMIASQDRETNPGKLRDAEILSVVKSLWKIAPGK